MIRQKPGLLLGIILVLLVVSSGLASQLAVLPAAFLPGNAGIGPAYNNQQNPAIARGGDKFLVVWEDSRAIAAGGTESETGRDIYGMRVDLSGNLLDATPIAISAGPASQTFPKVAWNGSNWLVVFQGTGPNGTGYYDQGLYAVRVSPAGQVLDPKPIPLFGTKPSGGAYWALDSDGSNWVVAVQGTSTSGDTVAIRIAANGTVLDPPVRAVLDASYYMRSNFKLAYAGGVFLMTYNGGNGTELVRFDSNLNVLSGPTALLSTYALNGLASNGSGFYMIWGQQQFDYTTTVMGSRLSTTGQMLDGAGVDISGNNRGPYNETIALTWDGLNWKTNWAYNGQVRVARVNTNGQVLDPGGAAVAGPQSGLAAGTGSGGVQLVWSPYANSDQGVVTANISAGGVAGPNREAAIGAPRQLRPDIASNGNGYLVVYLSSSASGHRVMAQPLDAAGNALSVEPIELASGDLTNGPDAPSVAWNGSVYLVTWGSSSAGGIVGQRLNPDGSKLDPAPFVVIAAAFGPADTAALGDTFLVTGRKCGYTCQLIDVWAARVSGATGAVVGAPFTPAGGYVSRAPAVTVVGGKWLLVYHSNWSHDNTVADTGALFVNPDGSVTAIGGLYNFSTGGGNGVFRIGLASNGSVALMAQSAEITSGVETDLLFRLIYPDGSIGPVVNATPWRGNQYNPQVAWDGVNFVIVYEDQKNRTNDLDMIDGRSDLFGMRVSPAGAILDPQGFVFSTSPNAETLPGVAAGNGAALIAAALVRSEAPYANYRIGYSSFGSPTNRPPVAVAAASPAGGDVPLAVNFSAAGSGDLDGSIAAYAWDFGDGASSTLANPSHTYTSAGPFVAHLTLTDNSGAQTTQAILVQAVAPNQPPVAVAQAVPAAGPAPLDVTFYADQSYDPDGAIGNIKWTFHDGSEYWGATAYYSYTKAGAYPVTLTVYDGRNATGTDTITVNVGGAATATLTATRTATRTATLAASRTPTATATRRGFKTATPTRTSTATRTATVPAGPTATATVTPTTGSGCVTNCLRSSDITLSTKGVLSITVTGKVTVRNESGTLMGGVMVTIRWNKPDGSQVAQSAQTDSSGVATFSTSGGRGTYMLTVTDLARAGYTFDAAGSVLAKSITR